MYIQGFPAQFKRFEIRKPLKDVLLCDRDSTFWYGCTTLTVPESYSGPLGADVYKNKLNGT